MTITTKCVQCKNLVSRRKSLAVFLSPEQDAQFVLARDSQRNPITRKALPRRHRGKCPE